MSLLGLTFVQLYCLCRFRVSPWLVAREALTLVKISVPLNPKGGPFCSLHTGFGNGEHLPTLLETAGLDLVVSVGEHAN